MQLSSDLNTVLPTNHNPLETHGQHVSNIIWIMSHRKRTYIYGSTPYSKYTLRRFGPLTAPSVSQVAKPLH